MMEKPDFREQYKRLSDVHPKQFNSGEKLNTIWEHVKDLDQDWFRRIVDNVVMSNDPWHERHDIGEAAKGERRARKAQELADGVIKLTENRTGISETGLTEVLNHLGVKSLSEAIEKRERGHG